MRVPVFPAQRRAFTLIELLVVIAIISLLAAILFPVFGRARENARRTSCLSNTKQIGIGMQQYIADYDEMFPMWSFPTPTGSKTYGWCAAVMPYIKSIQVFTCPSAVQISPTANDNRCNPRAVNASMDVNIGLTTGGGAGSYGYNYATMGTYKIPTSGPDSGLRVPDTHKLSEMTKAAETVMVTEVTATIGNQPGTTYYPTSWTQKPSTNPCSSSSQYSYQDQMATWHFDGTVVGFADGHAKWMRPAVLRDYDGNGTVDNGWFTINK